MSDEPIAQNSNPWKIYQQSFSEDRLLHYEGLFTLGSGLLHLRGSFEEQVPGEDQGRRYLRLPANVTSEKHESVVSHRGTYLPPVRANHPLLNSVIVNLPSPIGVELTSKGLPLHALSDRVVAQSRVLDMRRALLHREVEWQLERGSVHVVFERFVSRIRANLICQRMTLSARGSATSVDVCSTIDSDVTTNGYDHLENRVFESGAGIVSVSADVSGTPVWVGSTLRDAAGSSPAGVGHDQTNVAVFQQFSVELEPDVPVTFVKYSWVTAGDGSQGLRLAEAGRAALAEAVDIGFESVLAEHEHAWQKLWSDADVVLGADPALLRSMRFSLFSLLRSHRSGQTRFGICPKGHAGEAYFGRYFWDTEIYLLPFFIHSDPEHARDLLRYRVQSLEGAQANARRYGYPGARFAWEADGDGYEHCPNWQYADHEIHVTADVAFGIAHYVAATDDTDFLFREALPLLIEGARYWMARIDRRLDGAPTLLGVMGPDEYKPFSRDNAFTNRLVKFHLSYTAQCVRACAESKPDLWTSYAETLEATDEELESFEQIADALTIPQDGERQIIAQSADFHTYVDVDVARLRTEAGDSIGTGAVASLVSQERLYRIKALKQADVVALQLLFPDETDHETAVRTYEYYESVTTHDSSLSASTHATVAARLGRTDEAFGFLRRSLVVDVDHARGDAGQGIHIANCGGNWQTVVYGFLGLAPAFAREEVTLDPHLPAGIDEIACTVWWRGTQLAVAADGRSVTVTRRDGPALPVTVGGQRRVVDTEEQWSYGAQST